MAEEGKTMIDVLEGKCLSADVLDKGQVCLIDMMPRLIPSGSIGPEAAIVQAARVSYGAGTKTRQTDTNLVRYLMRCEHWSPFEMIELKFRVKCPIAIARQWMRHRTGAFNEESARYSIVQEEYYVPDAADVRPQSGNNRQGRDEDVDLGSGVVTKFLTRYQEQQAAAYSCYSSSLQEGVARETSRFQLPQSMYTAFYWKTDLRNLLHFLRLRMDSHAQKELRDHAEAIYAMLREILPVAIAAFDDYVLNVVTLTAHDAEYLRTGTFPKGMSKREQKEAVEKLAGMSLTAGGDGGLQ